MALWQKQQPQHGMGKSEVGRHVVIIYASNETMLTIKASAGVTRKCWQLDLPCFG